LKNEKADYGFYHACCPCQFLRSQTQGMETDLVKAMAAVVITKQVVYLAHSLVLAFPSSLSAMAPIGLCVAIGASRTLLKAFASESSASNKRAPQGALRFE
jgi:hypothetical protein